MCPHFLLYMGNLQPTAEMRAAQGHRMCCQESEVVGSALWAAEWWRDRTAGLAQGGCLPALHSITERRAEMWCEVTQRYSCTLYGRARPGLATRRKVEEGDSVAGHSLAPGEGGLCIGREGAGREVLAG